MRRQTRKRKCQHCKTIFVPDPRCVRRQRYCSNPQCRKANKAASQRRWHQQPNNRDSFTGPIQVERVRAWRQAHPGYWRRQACRPPHALQEDLTPQSMQKQALEGDFVRSALQDDFFMQPAVFVGLIAHLTGLALQDDIAITLRRWQQLGHDILSASPPQQGGLCNAQTPHLQSQTPTGAPPIQLGRSASGA